MKTKLITLAAGLALALFTSGCTSVSTSPNGTDSDSQPRIDPLDLVVSAGLAGVIHNNPQYRPLVVDVRDQLGVLLARGYTNPELVTEFLAKLDAKYDLTDTDVAALRDMLVSVNAIFQQAYGYSFPLNFALDERAKRFVKKAQVALTLEAGLELVFAAVD